jgi:hypothetical protein
MSFKREGYKISTVSEGGRNMAFKSNGLYRSTVDKERGILIRDSRKFRDTETPWLTYISDTMEFDFALNYEKKYLSDSGDVEDISNPNSRDVWICNIIESTVIQGIKKSLKNNDNELALVEYNKLKNGLIDGIYSLYSLDGLHLTKVNII